ncbi:Ankyrin repeat domain-containing protein 50 [Pleurostoma richardsiae]|uniref:Ankyrin repeat domain-containing protein 50 n=1 Tax=Pleurostoma richardsiae TaxID=41990 RepID=A0AA38VMX5_9PEZI|nr:Ankyrin repeat domain-containing protein 50 [Pleurostoma richardsiae]
MTESRSTHPSGGIPSAGLTVVFEPDEPDGSRLDIVFVHGFTGHPERTWLSKKTGAGRESDVAHARKSREPPSKRRRYIPFPTSRHNEETPKKAVYWPRDLVPITVPHARVLTYGYDTHIRHSLVSPENTSTVYDFAHDLLVELGSQRQAAPLRPVLFIAHSLGGIVVKEMLRQSKGWRQYGGQAHFHAVFQSTLGVMFFGTPHAGADPRGPLHRVAENIIKAFGFKANEEIIRQLLPSAERLRELRDEFGPMAEAQNWAIHSFQEQYAMMALGNCKAVEDTSSVLGVPAVEVYEHIGRDHRDMCRFSGVEDVEYKKVASALNRIIAATRKNPEKASRLNQEQRRELLDSLRFDQIDARRMTIKKAHAKTCGWLLKHPEYRNWLDPAKLNEHHGFLWIKGNPGTGKSTLMKFATANAHKAMKGIRTVISFFFNARGRDLEKSTLGMYRSILLQLLEQFPEL